MFKTVFAVALLLLLAGNSKVYAGPDAIVIPSGDVRIKGAGSGLVFPDGSIQYKATVQGPAGIQGPQGQQGPQGPPAQITLSAICNAISAANVALPSFCTGTSSSNAIVGTWGGGNPAVANDYVLFTFMADGRFFFGQAGTIDTHGQSGAEFGTYSWNQGTGVLTTSFSTDTNGEWGLSHPVGGQNIVSVSGNDITVADTGNSHTAPRLLPSATNTLIGSWKPSDYGVNGAYYILSFVDDSHFFSIEAGSSDNGGVGGIQLGTYTFNKTTGILTATSQAINTIGGTSGAPINELIPVTFTNGNNSMSFSGRAPWTRLP